MNEREKKRHDMKNSIKCQKSSAYKSHPCTIFTSVWCRECKSRGSELLGVTID